MWRNVRQPGHTQILRAGAVVGLSCWALRLVGAGVPIKRCVGTNNRLPSIGMLSPPPSMTSSYSVAYLDDVYILASPDRVAFLDRCLQDSSVAAGILLDAVPQVAPEPKVWVGDPALSPELRGLAALGVPLGSPACIESHLQQTLARSAARHAPAAFWSFWADVLPVIATRYPASCARRHS